MNWVRKIFTKNKNTNKCDIKDFSSNLKHTMTLGCTPIEMYESKKPNYEVLSIRYSDFDGYVNVALQLGTKVDVIKISSQEALSLGFINPYGLKGYCKDN